MFSKQSLNVTVYSKKYYFWSSDLKNKAIRQVKSTFTYNLKSFYRKMYLKSRI